MTDLERALQAAEAKRDEARNELTIAEEAYSAANREYSIALMAVHGITPYKTIFMFEGEAYAADLLYDGDPVIWRVTRDNRTAQPDPAALFLRWAEVTPTDRILVEDDE